MRQVTENFAMNHITNRENLERLLNMKIDTPEECGRHMREIHCFPINSKIKCVLCQSHMLMPIYTTCGCIFCSRCYYVTLRELDLCNCPLHKVQIESTQIPNDLMQQIQSQQYICPHHVGLRMSIFNGDPQCTALCSGLDEYIQHLKSECQTETTTISTQQLPQYFKNKPENTLKYAFVDKSEIEYIIKSFRETTKELPIQTYLFWDRMQIDYNGYIVTGEGHVGRFSDDNVPAFPQIQFIVMENQKYYNIQNSAEQNQEYQDVQIIKIEGDNLKENTEQVIQGQQNNGPQNVLIKQEVLQGEEDKQQGTQSKVVDSTEHNNAGGEKNMSNDIFSDICVYLTIEPPDDEQFKILKFNINLQDLKNSGPKRFYFTFRRGTPGRYVIRRLVVARKPKTSDGFWKIAENLQLITHPLINSTPIPPLYTLIDYSAPFQCGVGIGVEVVQRGAVYSLCTQFKETQFYQQIEQLYIQQNPTGFHQIERLTPMELNGLLTYLWVAEGLPDVCCGILAVLAFLRNRENQSLFLSQSAILGFCALLDRFLLVPVVQRLAALLIAQLLNGTKNLIPTLVCRIQLAKALHGDNEQFKALLRFTSAQTAEQVKVGEQAGQVVQGSSAEQELKKVAQQESGEEVAEET